MTVARRGEVWSFLFALTGIGQLDLLPRLFGTIHLTEGERAHGRGQVAAQSSTP